MEWTIETGVLWHFLSVDDENLEENDFEDHEDEISGSEDKDQAGNSREYPI